MLETRPKTRREVAQIQNSFNFGEDFGNTKTETLGLAVKINQLIAGKRVALFVDGANLYYAQRKLSWAIDFQKLIDFFSKGVREFDSFYYVGKTTPLDVQQQGFLDALTYMGYTVLAKDIKEVTDEANETKHKCNLDIEIAVDILAYQDQFDVFFLLSGNDDFVRLVETIRRRGKKIYASCCKGMSSRELVNAVNEFFWLEDLGPGIKRERNQKEGQAF